MNIVYIPGLLPDYENQVDRVVERISKHFKANVTVFDYHPCMLGETNEVNEKFFKDIKQVYCETIKEDVDIIYAHSTGGTIGIILAHDFPPKKALILSAPAIKPVNPSSFIKSKLLKTFGKQPAGTIDLTSEEVDIRDKKFFKQMRLCYLKFIFNASKIALELAPKIEIPTLIHQGGKDFAVRKSGSIKLSRVMPNATLIQYPELRHMLLEEKQYAQVLDTTADFIANLDYGKE